ncbi:MAG: quinone-dependent dihydroorotate dehydrogenase [Chloroflexota bacterium]|nr:MAG: quinone-dependent dihydroorotate dehydrogenase [Chloroflexota bacterium]
MYTFLRALLFRLQPEQAHGFTLGLVRVAGSIPPVRALLMGIFSGPPAPVSAFGLQFANPVGLAAGYDKDGLGWRGLACLGFGHIEIGTVTPRPQPGNPSPRLFRLPDEKALINRMGFPGKGSAFVARQLQGSPPSGLILGANLGKNKDTPLEEAARDYLELFDAFAPLADYLAINVSSPNTVGLRRLQARDALESLLDAVAARRQSSAARLSRRVPVLVKLAPDLNDDELDDALDAIQSTGMDGVIATNTTLNREGIRSMHAAEAGGLSGKPLFERSLDMVCKIERRTNGALPVVGVGGISSAADACRMLDAGATLVQLYTGLIYEGPGLVRQILRGLKDQCPPA